MSSFVTELVGRLARRAADQAGEGRAVGGGVGRVAAEPPVGVDAGGAVAMPGLALGAASGAEAGYWQAPSNLVERQPDPRQELLRRLLDAVAAQSQVPPYQGGGGPVAFPEPMQRSAGGPPLAPWLS